MANLITLMAFHSITKFSILYSLSVMNQYATLGFIGPTTFLPKKNRLFGRSSFSSIAVLETHTWYYRTQYSHYEWLLGAACGVIIGPYKYLWKWGRLYHYGQWRRLSHHDNRFFWTRFSWYWCDWFIALTLCWPFN